MKKLMVGSFVVALLTGMVVTAVADDVVPQMPKPQKEHAWLQHLVGEWDTEVEMFMDPTQPPAKEKGTESGRTVGEFWVMLESKGEFMGAPFTGIMTLGYDADLKKYVGTWVDSMTHRLWQYTGTVDPAGKILTLETEGPCPMQGGKIVRMRETIEIKSPDHKVFTSKVETDGQWVTGMTINYHRKKK